MPSATGGNKHGFKARLLDYPLAICRSHDDLKFIAKIVLNFKNPSSTVHIDNKEMIFSILLMKENIFFYTFWYILHIHSEKKSSISCLNLHRENYLRTLFLN